MFGYFSVILKILAFLANVKCSKPKLILRSITNYNYYAHFNNNGDKRLHMEEILIIFK